MLSQIFSPRKNKHLKDRPDLALDYTHEIKIPYKQNLIPELRRENRVILAAIELLMARIKESDVQTVRRLLVDMKRILTDHFIKENVSLYVYIKALYNHDEEKQAQLRELRIEMSGVQSLLFRFLNSYLNKDLIAVDLIPLGKELAVIGEVLVNRIRHEEQQLYPLYLPPSAE